MQLNLQDSTNIIERIPSIEDYTSNKMRKLIKRSAFIRYLFYNLKINNLKPRKKKEETFNANIEVNTLLSNIDKVKLATNYLVEKFKSENQNKRIIFLIDGPREDIYNETLDKSSVLFIENILREICSKNKVEFYSLTREFENTYQKNKKKFNADYDFHWNSYGHKVVGNFLFKNFNFPKDSTTKK